MSNHDGSASATGPAPLHCLLLTSSGTCLFSANNSCAPSPLPPNILPDKLIKLLASLQQGILNPGNNNEQEEHKEKFNIKPIQPACLTLFNLNFLVLTLSQANFLVLISSGATNPWKATYYYISLQMSSILSAKYSEILSEMSSKHNKIIEDAVNHDTALAQMQNNTDSPSHLLAKYRTEERLAEFQAKFALPLMNQQQPYNISWFQPFSSLTFVEFAGLFNPFTKKFRLQSDFPRNQHNFHQNSALIDTISVYSTALFHQFHRISSPLIATSLTSLAIYWRNFVGEISLIIYVKILDLPIEPTFLVLFQAFPGAETASKSPTNHLFTATIDPEGELPNLPLESQEFLLRMKFPGRLSAPNSPGAAYTVISEREMENSLPREAEFGYLSAAIASADRIIRNSFIAERMTLLNNYNEGKAREEEVKGDE
jgi:hypothetical protein